MNAKAECARKVPGAKIACIANGRDYVLNHRFAHRDCPKLLATLAKIREAGIINLENWHLAKKGEV